MSRKLKEATIMTLNTPYEKEENTHLDRTMKMIKSEFILVYRKLWIKTRPGKKVQKDGYVYVGECYAGRFAQVYVSRRACDNPEECD